MGQRMARRTKRLLTDEEKRAICMQTTAAGVSVAQVGLNKGEAHHALKNALRIGRQGEIRDRTSEGQHYRMAGLNLLTAIIIYWNTDQLGKAVARQKRAGLNCSAALLAHISPLGWAHILITGEYRWPKQ